MSTRKIHKLIFCQVRFIFAPCLPNTINLTLKVNNKISTFLINTVRHTFKEYTGSRYPFCIGHVPGIIR